MLKGKTEEKEWRRDERESKQQLNQSKRKKRGKKEKNNGTGGLARGPRAFPVCAKSRVGSPRITKQKKQQEPAVGPRSHPGAREQTCSSPVTTVLLGPSASLSCSLTAGSRICVPSFLCTRTRGRAGRRKLPLRPAGGTGPGRRAPSTEGVSGLGASSAVPCLSFLRSVPGVGGFLARCECWSGDPRGAGSPSVWRRGDR